MQRVRRQRVGHGRGAYRHRVGRELPAEDLPDPTAGHGGAGHRLAFVHTVSGPSSWFVTPAHFPEGRAARRPSHGTRRRVSSREVRLANAWPVCGYGVVVASTGTESSGIGVYKGGSSSGVSAVRP